MTSQVTLHAFAPPSSTTTRPKQISVMLSLEAAKATVRSAESHAAGWKNRKKKKRKIHTTKADHSRFRPPSAPPVDLSPRRRDYHCTELSCGTKVESAMPLKKEKKTPRCSREKSRRSFNRDAEEDTDRLRFEKPTVLEKSVARCNVF